MSDASATAPFSPFTRKLASRIDEGGCASHPSGGVLVIAPAVPAPRSLVPGIDWLPLIAAIPMLSDPVGSFDTRYTWISGLRLHPDNRAKANNAPRAIWLGFWIIGNASYTRQEGVESTDALRKY
jgi:hypothetical protein